MKNSSLRLILSFCLTLFSINIISQNNYRWEINNEKEIIWKIGCDIPHEDHIEMSGKSFSTVLRYGVDENGSFKINKSLIWPLLRTIPNNTHASLMRRYDWNILNLITVNGKSLLCNEKVEEIRINESLSVRSIINESNNRYIVEREYFPSTEKPALIESYRIINIGENSIYIELPNSNFSTITDNTKCVEGTCIIEGGIDRYGYYTIYPKDTLCFSASLSARYAKDPSVVVDALEEKIKRKENVNLWMDNLQLETPDSIINTMFAFSKVRACESIFETKGGPMHSPGGESYYAAIWANDQAEYINPYFPFIGYEYGNESALNSFKHFARFMNDKWEPIPSSIIAEGLDVWNGAGDRGDAAMIAYGASRYVLAFGDKNIALELWPLIAWCLEYCNHKLNDAGVVASDTDELENRFESGDANLCTSSLYYDALISASYLAKELKMEKNIINDYKNRAEILQDNIEKYFGCNVEGFKTYAYYKGNSVLRSWICMPLTVGIFKRAQGTIDALFSSRLWTKNGLLTEAGSKTFWDRSTLYALRGVYAVGEAEKATEYLHDYSANRLLGEHVPYAIEAWPEGEQRHLSAESALYGRIITEGMFGIRPKGFRTFDIKPSFPQAWRKIALRNIRAFGSVFDVTVHRISPDKLRVIVFQNNNKTIYNIKDGDIVNVVLK